MKTVAGKVVNGRVELEDTELPEGAAVTVSYHEDDQAFELTEEQELFIQESIAEIERGEYVDGDDVIRELRRRRGLA
jgi:hypothetical protein